jgi:DNA replication and repair protein RecF
VRAGVALANSREVTNARVAEPATTDLWVSRLFLTNFRSYERIELVSDGRLTVLSGANGAGKTNLLEALSMLAPGRGLRGARLSDLDRRMDGDSDPAPWAVAARIEAPGGQIELGTGRSPEPGRERRVVRIEGKPAGSQQALAEALALVWLTPEMNRLFTDAPASRRRFLDRLVVGFDPAHATRVAAFDRARTERARLLRAGRIDPAWLGALEQSMAEKSIAIAAARLEVVSALTEALNDGDDVFPRPTLRVAGWPEELLETMPALVAEETLCAALGAGRARDAEQGGALGAHRSDLVATYAATGRPADQCSTGEQKALLVAVLLAYVRRLARHRGTMPVLLFDEIAAHLDAARLAALFETLLDLGCQAWLTGTERADFANLDRHARFYSLTDSILSEE